MEAKKITIKQEELLEELELFTQWSGPFLVRIMGNSNIPGYDPPFTLGSGGLLKYRNRYFAITNHHVIKNLANIKEDIRIPYTVKDLGTFSMTVLEAYSSSMEDLAAFEVRYNSYIEKSNHSFITEDYIDYKIKEFASRTNITFIHGYPAIRTNIDDARKEIEAITFPYCTFIDRFDERIQSLFVFVNDTGVSKFSNEEEVPDVSGMSGSFVYGYYHDEFPRYKLIGVLTSWDKSESTLEIYPIKEFTDFIDKKFFN